MASGQEVLEISKN